jgi:adenine-specific DNA-methyltransferase
MAFSEKLAPINSSKKIRHQILPASGFARETLRTKGQFWTPEWVAEAMTNYVLLDKSPILFDPAVGEGVFYQTAKKLNLELGYIPKLFGYEIDSEVLRQSLKNGLSLQDLANVQISDFVLDSPNQKFSAIVSNPPYIRHHRLSLEKKLLLKQFCTNLIGYSVDGRAGFHVYFFLRALELLAENGRLAFIMPADVCEGIFAEKLWQWITRNFCLEAVITFTSEATPFPDVDTNPLVFFVKKSQPKTDFLWVKCKKSWTKDLRDFVVSNFNQKADSLEIHQRKIEEGIKTGLSRSPENKPDGIELSQFVRVMRGIATGANDFFFFTRSQAKEKNIPNEFLQTAIGRTRDIESEEITFEDIDALDKKGRPTLLFSPDGRKLENFPREVKDYLIKGEKLGLPEKALISQRKPWYRMEKRVPPTFLFAYLGRRNVRFVKNTIGVLPLTGFLCVYSLFQNKDFNENLWFALNHPDTLFNLQFVGKSYGSGAIKVEPRSLEKLIIPNHIIKKFELPKLSLF